MNTHVKLGSIEFRVNGETVRVEAGRWQRLSEVLRNDLGLTGTKIGCDAGDCGACTVLIDGELACACLTAAGQVEGSDVVTVEGLDARPGGIELKQAFLEAGAAQCGICTPGMLVSAASLLQKTPQPSKHDIEGALGGVLCRCTGYSKIVEAVSRAAGLAPTERDTRSCDTVGARLPRVDGAAKVDGSEVFGADGFPDGCLIVKVIRSPHHHARFSFGDLAEYAADTGVTAIMTAADIPGKNCHGVIPPLADQPVFAERIARFRGEAVAMVVGEREIMAALDVDEFPVTWSALPCVLTPREAMQDTAPLLHKGREQNVMIRGLVQKGDVDAGLARAHHVVERSFSTPFVEHAYIEPEAGWAERTGDKIVVHGCTQAPHMDREALSAIMDLPDDRVRIVPTGCGGGFGSKLDISMQPYVALAAWQLGRPCGIVYSRQESMRSTTKRHPSEITLRAGCDARGRLTGFDFHGVFNTGAYASWGPTVANRVPVHASGPYFVEHYRARSTAVHTHCAPSGAFRGFGVPQSAVAQECVFDELADAAGIDRLEFRRINALRDGQPTATGQVFQSGVGIVACLDALEPHWRQATTAARAFNAKSCNPHLRMGVGLATCWYGCGNTSLPNPSTMMIGIDAEARVWLHQGAMDIGQGATTVMAQIAAQAIGVPVAQIRIKGGDTAITPDAGKTSASRQTFVSGNATRLAGEALRAKILRHANVSPGAHLSLGNGVIDITDAGNSHRIELATSVPDGMGYVFSAVETYDPPTTALDENGQGEPYAVFGYGAQLMELTVDCALGSVSLDRLTAAHDVGKAINPLLVEGQIEGGAAQGIGMALMEEYRPGQSDNLHDYLIPTFGDMPEVTSIIVEVPDPHGPYGAKGLGEHVLIPTAPAILNAIRDATGASVRDLPATPDKVLAAIHALENGDG